MTSKKRKHSNLLNLEPALSLSFKKIRPQIEVLAFKKTSLVISLMGQNNVNN
jgi:hypothetical protein